MFSKEPKSSWNRYAFGYTDKKPGASFWIVHAFMVLFILYNLWW